MKQYIIAALLIVTVQVSFGQSPFNIKVKRIETIHTKIVNQKKDEKRIELYRFFSKYFTDSNIYPNPDAIDLVDAYNKELTLEEIKSSQVTFKELLFEDVAPAVKEKIKTDSVLAAKPNRTQNVSFKSAIETFSQKYKLIKENAVLAASFRDSLAVFGRQVLPLIHINSYKIPAMQMEFFTFSLNDINQLIEQLPLPGNVARIMAVNELMKDFFEFKANSIKNGMYRSSPAAYGKHAAANGLYFAAYNPPLEAEPLKVDERNELANANIYVYTRGANGKWDQAPKPNSYNVFYGPNGLKYSLTPGCDTLSFFKFRPSVPASTLPVVLAKGNYCFVLQDVNTHQLFLRPDINLRDNQVVDHTKLIRLCFKVENH